MRLLVSFLSIRIGLMLCLIAGLLVTPAAAGPLTNIFLKSIEGQGETSWREGFQEGQVETLQDVVIRLKNGRRYDIEQLRLDYSEDNILIEATGFLMNPEGAIRLLKADRISFYGHYGLIKTFWTLDMITDACLFAGIKSGFKVEGFGAILKSSDSLLSQDNKFLFKTVDLSVDVVGNSNLCTAQFNLGIDRYQSLRSDGSSRLSERFELEFGLPGNISSLIEKQDENIIATVSAKSVSDLISGGATAWSFIEGHADMSFSALGMVPAITLTLQYKDAGYSSEYWMNLWNSFKDMQGDLRVSLDNMSLRAGNILPPEYATRFVDAGLTTMLLDTTLALSVETGSVDLQGSVMATGLMQSTLDTAFRLGAYPEKAIALQKSLTAALRRQSIGASFNIVPPVYIDRLHYTHTDDGLIDSATNIMGVPVTVWISQIREAQAKKYPKIALIIRQIATEAASFSALSRKNPPARIDLSVGEGLDLREALIVTQQLPEEILNIFNFSVSSGPNSEQDLKSEASQ